MILTKILLTSIVVFCVSFIVVKLDDSPDDFSSIVIGGLVIFSFISIIICLIAKIWGMK